jgi:hypothetical protein
LLLTSTLTPTPLTLTRRGSCARRRGLLRNAVNAGKRRKERERSCNSQRAHGTR